jgi:hypothetical protein
VIATEKSMRRPDFPQLAAEELQPGETGRIEMALAHLKHAMRGDDRAAIQEKTHVLNHVTQHLAEVVMNRTVRAALAGKNVDDIK